MARVLRVLELIQSRGRWTTKAIAEEIECSERTVYRDLDVLRFLQSIAEIKTVGHLIDSDLSHDVSWDTARQELRCQAEAEYFDIPRGRIVWDTVHRAGILYHGNETPVEAFEELARLFRLPRWEARLDEHYLTGEALEEFYRLD
ncbi:MAG: helix-turn-helix domain-containing protein [Planctomycetes bacterium]|nr:helix-turn-helix domain-containing protein [Planctomycetota bacterium]